MHFFFLRSVKDKKKTLSTHSPESFLWSTIDAWHTAANANAREQSCAIQIHHCWLPSSRDRFMVLMQRESSPSPNLFSSFSQDWFGIKTSRRVRKKRRCPFKGHWNAWPVHRRRAQIAHLCSSWRRCSCCLGPPPTAFQPLSHSPVACWDVPAKRVHGSSRAGPNRHPIPISEIRGMQHTSESFSEPALHVFLQECDGQKKLWHPAHFKPEPVWNTVSLQLQLSKY